MSHRIFRYPASVNDICAVVTTYRPEESFPNHIQRIAGQVGLVVIVDDGDSEDNAHQLKQWFGGLDNIIIHHNPQNSGVAYSLNYGVSIAKDKGYQWVLLFDDDSVVPENMTVSLLQAMKIMDCEKPLAIIGADYSLPNDTSRSQVRNPVPMAYATLTRISSGSLMSIEAYDKLGHFKEDYFIDYVDIEYCLRAQMDGYLIMNVSHLGMIHPVGSGLKKGLFTIRSQHSPERQYYFFRNSTDIIRRYGEKFMGFSLLILCNQFKVLLKIIFFQDNKMLRLKLMLQGIGDAFRGRFGRISLL